MTRRAWTLGCLLATATSLALLVACGEDGTTPDCPPLPIYDVRNDADVQENQNAINAAAAEGCVTRAEPPDGGVSGQ